MFCHETATTAIYTLSLHDARPISLKDLLTELEKTSGRDLGNWSRLWLEEAGITTLTSRVQTDEQGIITAMRIDQTAPEEHPVLRPPRLAVGFYDEDQSGKVVRQIGRASCRERV